MHIYASLSHNELKSATKGPMDNKTALVPVMVGHLTSNKPLPEQIMPHFSGPNSLFWPIQIKIRAAKGRFVDIQN